MASWVLWSWGNFTENTSQRKLLSYSWILSVWYELFTSRNLLFPILEISVYFKWLNFIGSSNSPYLTLLLGLMLWSSWQLPALVPLPSCHKAVLGRGLIPLCICMHFPVWTGFVTQENSARASEKRGTCSSHVAGVSRPFFPTKEKKRRSYPEETTSQSTLNCMGRRTTVSEESGVTPWLLLAASFSMGGKCFFSSLISGNWKTYVAVSALLWRKACDLIMSRDDTSQAPSSSFYISVLWGQPV